MNISLLFAFFDEALQTLPAICDSRFSPKTYSDSRENRTLPTAVVSDDKVYKRAERHLKIPVTHEICTRHAFEDAIIGWDIVHVLLLPLLGGILVLLWLRS